MDESDDVDKFLQEIEQKYSLKNKNVLTSQSINTEQIDQLHILSQEFETLGLPALNTKLTGPNLLQEIVNNTLSLIQLHRKTLLQVTDAKIFHRTKDANIYELKREILNLKMKLKSVDDEKMNIERNWFKTKCQCEELRKRISMHSKETHNLKHYFKSKQDKLLHQVNSLQNENHHLKEMCGKDIDKYFNKEDKFLKILKNYKHNEEVYKNALNTLEENNVEIMNEILNLRQELAMAYLKNN